MLLPAALLCMLPRIAGADDSRPELVFMVFAVRDRDSMRTVQNVRERLFDVPVDVRVRWVETPTDPLERAAMADEELRLSGASLVFYLEEDSIARAYYLLPRDGQPRRLVRRLDGTGDLGTGDAMALITLTTVELLLDTGELTPPPPPPPRPAAVAAPEPARFFADAGYRFIAASARPDISHGGSLRLSLRFFKPLRAFVAAGFATPLTSSEDGVQVSSAYYPVTVGLAAMGKKGRLSAGGALGAVFSAIYRTPRATADYDVRVPYTGFEFAIEATAAVELEVAPHVALFAGPVLQVIPARAVCVVKDGPVLFDEYRRVRVGFTAGVQFFAF